MDEHLENLLTTLRKHGVKSYVYKDIIKIEFSDAPLPEEKISNVAKELLETIKSEAINDDDMEFYSSTGDNR